ncbi:MAG: hypothetical protein ACTSVW_05510 [Candidatus Njordarchaeales archaeon]
MQILTLALLSAILVICGGIHYKKSWKYRNLLVIKLLIISYITTIGALSLFLLSTFSFNIGITLVSGIIAELILSIAISFYVITIESLRVPRASDVVLTLVGLAVFFRFLSLILYPPHLLLTEDLLVITEDIITTYHLISISLLGLLITIEFALMILKGFQKKEKKRAVLFLGIPLSFSFLIGLHIIFNISLGPITASLYCVRYILVSVISCAFSIAIYYDPESILLLPVEIFGVAVTTKEGVEIASRTLREERTKHVRLGTLLLGLIYSLNLEFERRELTDAFESITLEDFNLLIYYGRSLIGTVIGKGQNLIVEDWLKNVVRETEKKIGEIESGLITDHEITIAEKVLDDFDWIFEK